MCPPLGVFLSKASVFNRSYFIFCFDNRMQRNIQNMSSTGTRKVFYFKICEFIIMNFFVAHFCWHLTQFLICVQSKQFNQNVKIHIFSPLLQRSHSCFYQLSTFCQIAGQYFINNQIYFVI